jgi:hypothetical protein
LIELRELSFRDWIFLKPLNLLLKEIRNDLWLRFYIGRKVDGLDKFLDEVTYLAGRNVVVVVAFEQPWALNWLLRMAKKNLQDATVIVFDNSRKVNLRKDIERVCLTNQAHYLSLPFNNTKHVNRSHGMAMSWIYHNIVNVIKPSAFAFVDHDLIPVSPVNLTENLGGQSFYGRVGGNNPKYWSLWAGYCIFAYQYLQNRKINFLYDFSRGLDTGGRNWDSLYSTYDKSQLAFAAQDYKTIYIPGFNQGVSVEFIDGKWMHMGRISYRDGFKDKFVFFEALANELEKDSNWQRLL